MKKVLRGNFHVKYLVLPVLKKRTFLTLIEFKFTFKKCKGAQGAEVSIVAT